MGDWLWGIHQGIMQTSQSTKESKLYALDVHRFQSLITLHEQFVQSLYMLHEVTLSKSGEVTSTTS